ncbi:MAG: hypothetical protein E7559_08635 [Ruminococcaceae bacterium]|nr:hypothetical protein [Oscillospiraceae bacterium]
MKFLQSILRTLVLLAAGAAALLLPQVVARGISDGVQLCISVVVPSLFFMMLLSVLLVQCGAVEKAAPLLTPLARSLFGMPGEGAAALLLTVVGGYPAGAKAVCSLYQRGAVSKAQAQRMAMVCFCSGPAFVLGAVGAMVGSSRAVLLLCVQLAVLFPVGIVARLLVPAEETTFQNKERKREQTKKPKRTAPKEESDFASAVVVSVEQTASALLKVCLFVALFSAVGAVLRHVGADGVLCRLTSGVFSEETARALLPVVLEVTAGTTAAVQAGLPAVAFALGFGGIAVHMQVLAICRPIGIDYSRFLLLRLLQGALCALLTGLMLPLLKDEAVAALSAGQTRLAFSSAPTGAATLLVMCIMYTLCTGYQLNSIDIAKGRKTV